MNILYTVLSHKVGRLLWIGALCGFLLGVFSVMQDARLAWLALIIVLNGYLCLSNKLQRSNHIPLLISILTALYLLMAREFPLPTIIWLSGVKTAPYAPMFDIQTNTTKLFIALSFLPLLSLLKSRRSLNIPISSLIYLTLVYLTVLTGVTTTTGLFFKYIVFDFTFPIFFPVWLVSMVILCFYEELYYRGVIQNYLVWLLPKTQSVAIILAAVMFGLSHWYAGWIMVGLSTIAGIFYGSLYKTTGRLWCPIILHCGLNTLHLLFFSYPRLA